MAMLEDNEDRDAIYTQGYQDGQNDLIKKIKSNMKKINKHRDYLNNILHDPEKLIRLAQKDPEVNAAITTAVVAILLEDAEKNK